MDTYITYRWGKSYTKNVKSKQTLLRVDEYLITIDGKVKPTLYN